MAVAKQQAIDIRAYRALRVEGLCLKTHVQLYVEFYQRTMGLGFRVEGSSPLVVAGFP